MSALDELIDGYEITFFGKEELVAEARAELAAKAAAIEELKAKITSLTKQRDGYQLTAVKRTEEIAAKDAAIEELKTNFDAYAVAARAIGLWLERFCDEELSYDKMIAQAARDAAKYIEKQDAAIAAAREFTDEYLSEEYCLNCLAVLPEHDNSMGDCKAGKLAAALEKGAE